MKRKKTAVCRWIILMSLFFRPGVFAEAESARPSPDYSFVYLGDMHFDQMEHHDFDWLKAHKPGDLRQIENYVRITETQTPRLLKEVRSLADASGGGLQMVLQGGDLVEGLCGSYEFQITQFVYAKSVVKQHLGGLPFITVKGNHDITGPGADKAYADFMIPWMSQECGKSLDSTTFCFMKGPDLFVVFDAYSADLDRLETMLKANPHRYAFVLMHPPVVPYNARSSWHIFSNPKDTAKRERLLEILGRSSAIVLTGHLHEFSLLRRNTSKGSFVQLSIGSVISSETETAEDVKSGVEQYNGELVNLEPRFQPETRELREAILNEERGKIAAFEYARFGGSAVLHVSDAGVSVDVYVGGAAVKWKTFSF